MTPDERGRIMHRFADLIERNADELSKLESLDNGKPAAVAAAADIPMTIRCLRYFAGWCDKMYGQTIPSNGPFFSYTLHEPIGVCAAIIPWNFPILMAAWKYVTISPGFCELAGSGNAQLLTDILFVCSLVCLFVCLSV